jgi:shikimate kinase
MLEKLSARGVVVCLHASIETILARTGRHGETRPLLDVEDPDARARALYAEREADLPLGRHRDPDGFPSR